MKLQLIGKEGKPLEFNEDIEVDKLDLYHNEYFLDLLEMVDKLRFALSDALDVLDENGLMGGDIRLNESIDLENEAIKLLTKVCE